MELLQPLERDCGVHAFADGILLRRMQEMSKLKLLLLAFLFSIICLIGYRCANTERLQLSTDQTNAKLQDLVRKDANLLADVIAQKKGQAKGAITLDVHELHGKAQNAFVDWFSVGTECLASYSIVRDPKVDEYILGSVGPDGVRDTSDDVFYVIQANNQMRLAAASEKSWLFPETRKKECLSRENK